MNRASRVIAKVAVKTVVKLSQQEKNQWIEDARIAYADERYNDMAACMHFLVKHRRVLTVDEIQLFIMSFKKTIEVRYLAWDRSNARLEGTTSRELRIEIIKKMKKIEAEMHKICYDIRSLLDNNIFIEAYMNEQKLVFYQMKAYCYSYLVPIAQDPREKQYMIYRAYRAFSTAYEVSKASLKAAHPARLDVALSFGRFYECFLHGQQNHGIKLVKEAVRYANKDLECGEMEIHPNTPALLDMLNYNLMKLEMSISDQEKAHTSMVFENKHYNVELAENSEDVACVPLQNEPKWNATFGNNKFGIDNITKETKLAESKVNCNEVNIPKLRITNEEQDTHVIKCKKNHKCLTTTKTEALSNVEDAIENGINTNNLIVDGQPNSNESSGSTSSSNYEPNNNDMVNIRPFKEFLPRAFTDIRKFASLC